MPLDKVEREWRERFERRRMLKRINANTIIAGAGFRDHFCTHPGRHSWDLCGHPLYYWAFKAIMDSKYIQKLSVYTEVKEALEIGKKMSDKFVPVERPLENCQEPGWEIMDDLKTPNSRKIGPYHTTDIEYVEEREKEVLGDIKPVRVICSVPNCLVTTKSIDRLIEAYFSDPFAEKARLFYRCPLGIHMKDPTTGYFLSLSPFAGDFGRRQQGFQLYHFAGYSIEEYGAWSQGRTIGVEIPATEGIDIGDEEDLRIARIFMEARLKES